ncbi:hypothetical protein DVH05_027496 [Phytophthora capsici]|nr:hypothetical protein DVH05_027496 [Phytophthora capsici]
MPIRYVTTKEEFVRARNHVEVGAAWVLVATLLSKAEENIYTVTQCKEKAKDFIFSNCDECTAILCPIHINADIAHRCGAVFDMKRRLVWVYDPLHKDDYEAEVTALLKNVYLPLVNPAYWKSDYIERGASAMVSAVAYAVAPMTKTLSETELKKVRYMLFRYVLFGMTERGDN